MNMPRRRCGGLRRGLMVVAVRFALVEAVGRCAALHAGDEAAVSIRTDFPGGNVVVVRNEGRSVHLRPDLRGGDPWFYWHFEAAATAPGTVDFVFDGSPMIGVRGPAFSIDGGATWRWLGTESVRYAPADGSSPRRESFRYEFAGDRSTVRFAVALPYLEHDLSEFLRRHAENRHLRRHVLTRTRSGKSVELLQIGEPRPNVEAVLVTARHHACESTASFVLEGWIEEALSDSPFGRAFRERYVLFAVPLVDKDGVQAGDQGKNRSPHDHNRDYGDRPIYPEVRAIQDLADAQRIRYSLDLHCPALRGDVHEAFHFLGLGVPHLKNNVDEWIAWIREERPSAVMAPLNFLTDPAKPGAANRRMNAHFFALRDSAVFAATLEIPYTQPNCPLDAAMARSYGAALLRAWTRTKFVARDESGDRGAAAAETLLDLRNGFFRTFRSRPEYAEEMLRSPAAADSVLRPEAHHLLAALRLHQRRFADAEAECVAALEDDRATLHQRTTARLLRVQIAAADPSSSEEVVERRLNDLSAAEYLSGDVQGRAFAAASDFHHRAGRIDAAIQAAQRQAAVAASYERGTILNRIATWHDQARRPEQAVRARREAVELLRPQLLPKPPRSIFGATMAFDLFEALCGIPTATLDEKRQAAELVLSHDIVTADRKAAVRKKLDELQRP